MKYNDLEQFLRGDTTSYSTLGIPIANKNVRESSLDPTDNNSYSLIATHDISIHRHPFTKERRARF